ncbi:2-dehydropantoate 2-reductase (Ketopantoate reductase) (KPA reductase) (KPR) [Coemansia javaensis]|uniref:2-dehydropantoate 2-reductase n=1 Tax=Coemansia javaensis TaxID=2761396 RepID=A0A9W8HA03_9FUNG|nr:2-dehydropantoate 2-reductase (Ketopantoate reductase) (KPA reductase) (KPR) [Coemansia javaensis]
MGRPRVHVLGAGAVGLLFAAHLRWAGHPVTLLLRSQAAVGRFAGRVVVADEWAQAAGGAAPQRVADRIQAEVAAPPSHPGSGSSAPIERLLVATKAQDAAAACAAVRHRLGRQSTVALLQNGLGVAEAVRDALGPGAQPALIVGTTSHGCHRFPGEEFGTRFAAPGACAFAVHPPPPPPSPGAVAAPPPSAQQLADALVAAPGLAATPVADWADLHVQLLLKLAANATINPATALAGCRNGRIWPGNDDNDDAVRRYLPLVCAEAAAIYGRAHPALRHRLTARAIEDHVAAVVRATARNRSSMLQDLDAGRRTEIGWINGHLVRLAEQHGVPAPANTLLYALVRLREQQQEQQQQEQQRDEADP